MTKVTQKDGSSKNQESLSQSLILTFTFSAIGKMYFKTGGLFICHHIIYTDGKEFNPLGLRMKMEIPAASTEDSKVIYR